jgi:hypothetical protein
VATELASNAIRHTTSGRGGWFAAEVTWHASAVQVAVADGGGPAEPHVIDDPGGEHGRGLLLVRGLSVRTGFTGDQRGRLVWAQIAWDETGSAAPASAQDPYQAAIRDGEATLARRFAGVPAWFGRSTLAWWAMAGPHGLVSASSAKELAGLLHRLLDTPAHAPAAGHPHRRAIEQRAPHRDRRTDAGDPDAARLRRPGTVSTGMEHPGTQDGRQHRRPAVVPRPTTIWAASLARA